MAILDHPLYGTEAKGKIKSTLTFFPRSANPLSTDEGDDVWYQIRAIGYRKESAAASRETQKNLFREALQVWYALPQDEKIIWESESINLQTPYNSFLWHYMATPFTLEGYEALDLQIVTVFNSLIYGG